jgi:hypothetical protein
MNHTTLAITVAMLAAITAALTGTIAIGIQSAAAQTTDLENSGTDSKFKEKDKNNCSGFTVCCNTASESLTGALLAIPVCPIR